MFRDASPAALSAFAFALGALGFAAGFAASTAFPASPTLVQPIVDANAWRETAPVQPVSYSQPATSQRCNPWQVSDIAMEEILTQMIRRGWRAPSQGDAIAALEIAGVAAVEPYAPMPQRRVWNASASSEVVEDLSSDQATPATTEAADQQPTEPAKDDRPPA